MISEEELNVKKNLKTQEEKKPRRLTLNRETVKLLDDPALLRTARGGDGGITTSGNEETKNTLC